MRFSKKVNGIGSIAQQSAVINKLGRDSLSPFKRQSIEAAITHERSVMRVKLLICTAGLAHGLLTGCTSSRYTGDSPYGKWLSADESVREVIKDGPFTMLAIEYRTGGSFLTSTRLDYYRILYRDRILVKKVERAGHWAGATVPVFFAEIYGRNGYELHIVHEQAGKPVVEHITAGDDRWRAEEGYSYGYPLSKDVRYFPPSLGTRGNGFSVDRFPRIEQVTAARGA
jgi:hypothetical protein